MPTVQTEILDDQQARLIITVEPDRVEKELRAAASRISKHVNIPGFRKGKAPYTIIQRYFGDDAIFDEAIEQMAQTEYRNALDESDLQPYAPGTLHEVKRDPVVLEFTVPLIPDVSLGKYRNVRLPYTHEKVTSKDVDHVIEHLQDEQAVIEVVNRPAALQDVVLVDIHGTVDSKTDKKTTSKTESQEKVEDRIIDQHGVRVLLRKGAEFPMPGFAEKMVGISAGEERSFDLKLSKDAKSVDESLRGKSIHFEVACKEVQKREVPGVDDEFARSLGDYDDLKTLKDKIQEQLEQDAERTARSTYIDQVLEHMIEKVATMKYPPVMLDEQIDQMIEDFDRQLRQEGLNLDDYLNLNKRTKDDLRTEFAPAARKRLEKGLLLGEISRVENIAVSDDDVDDEIQTRLLSFGAQASLMQSLMKSPEMRRSIRSTLLTEKTLDLLVKIAKGESLEEISTPAEKQAKPGKSASSKAKTSSRKKEGE